LWCRSPEGSDVRLAVVTAGGKERRPALPSDFNKELPVGPLDGNSAFFGLDVLRGLVAGIDDFIAEKQPRRKQFHSVGPVLLGSAMWINERGGSPFSHHRSDGDAAGA
jgi:hypothetical protein